MFAIALAKAPTEASIKRLDWGLRAALRPAIVVEGHNVHVDVALAADSATAGVAADEMLRRAELALRGGSNDSGVSTFELRMETEVDRRRQIDAELRQAIGRGELTVVFQPQISLADGAWSASRRWCAGIARSSARSRRPTSSRWPKKRA